MKDSLLLAIRSDQRGSGLKSIKRALAATLIALALAACVDESATPDDVLATPTLMLATPTPAMTPTTVKVFTPLNFVAYRHKSGVFSVSQPDDWEVIDSSTDQRLSVRFVPPPGFGSRVIVEATNEGVLAQDQIHNKAESYIALNYTPNPAYHEVNRSDLPDGRIQAIYDYDDTHGGTGRETLTFQQVGPFLIVLRVFLANVDEASLSAGLDTMASSLIVDPQAAWGTSVAAINPAELIVANTLLWQSGDTTNVMGEVRNASPADATNVQAQITLCDRNGATLSPLSTGTGIKVIDRGGSAPFAISIQNLPRGVQICAQQASGEPAKPDPDYTTALSLTVTPSINSRGRLVLDSQVGNPGLAPVKNIHVALVVYDADNRVVGYGTVDSQAEILLYPGQTWSISYIFETLGGKADRYVALAEAQIVNPSNPSLNP